MARVSLVARDPVGNDPLCVPAVNLLRCGLRFVLFSNHGKRLTTCVEVDGDFFSVLALCRTYDTLDVLYIETCCASRYRGEVSVLPFSFVRCSHAWEITRLFGYIHRTHIQTRGKILILLDVLYFLSALHAAWSTRVRKFELVLLSPCPSQKAPPPCRALSPSA